MNISLNSKKTWLIVLGVIILLAIAYLGYSYYSLYKENDIVKADRSNLRVELDELKQEKLSLESAIRDQQYTLDSFVEKISDIGLTVGTLEKLSQTDEELLEKYSKIYFLNENYIPARLAIIDEKYMFEKKSLEIHADVWPYLQKLLIEAEDKGTKLLIVSAYRSFDTQASLKYGYRVTYGSGANQFSADQGYSEHQLGTTVDFTTVKTGAYLSRFDSDPAYKWLQENVYKYGFVLSYPKGNSYYKFEPWHWRFVGVELATKLHDENKYFYDLDQREIDEYLVKLFD